MTEPKIENRITTGNLLSLATTMITAVTVIVTLFIWGARQDERVNRLMQMMNEANIRISANEARIRAVENSSARQDEKLILILDALRKIETQLDRAR